MLTCQSVLEEQAKGQGEAQLDEHGADGGRSGWCSAGKKWTEDSLQVFS
jgi:hypothetical protein